MGMSFTSSMLLSLYGGLWQMARPFLKNHSRLREEFAERLVPEGWPCHGNAEQERTAYAQGPRIWLQAASGGEAWLAHSLLPPLAATLAARANASSVPPHILCTTCTRQGLEVLAKLVASAHDAPAHASFPHILPRYLPLDHPGLMERALTQAAPHLLLLLETELWPGLMAAAAKRGVPVLILNARMTEKSFSGYSLTPSFWRDLAPAAVLAVSEADAGRFGRLFGQKCRVELMPNIKFDRVAFAPPAPFFAGLRIGLGIAEDSLLAVLASVREEEEDLLLPVLRALCARPVQDARALFAVAPRHMHRISAWKDKLTRAGLPYALRSQTPGAPATPTPPVLLWDTFGELASLYGMADAVFVGGSLAPLGGQNFLEPAAQGLVPLVGPHTRNFLWAGEEFFTLGLGRRVHPNGLETALERALDERLRALTARMAQGGAKNLAEARLAEQQTARRRFDAWLSPRLGGSALAARAVVEFLQNI